ncbi:MAG: 16S rRNA (cytosine(1402)-N(4))-methyltransferase, partial [uncultured Thermomicrobiales bacterium]
GRGADGAGADRTRARDWRGAPPGVVGGGLSRACRASGRALSRRHLRRRRAHAGDPGRQRAGRSGARARRGPGGGGPCPGDGAGRRGSPPRPARQLRGVGGGVPGGGVRHRGRGVPRSRVVVVPARRSGTRLRLPLRRAAGHAVRPQPGRTGRRAGQRVGARGAGRSAVPLRRGTPLAPDRRRDRPRADDGALRLDRPPRRRRRDRPGRAAWARHPPRDPDLSGPADRGQRGAGRAPGGPARRGRGLAPGGAIGGDRVPLARGSDRQAVHRRRERGLRLPAAPAGLYLRPGAAPAQAARQGDPGVRRRNVGQPAEPERGAARGGTPPTSRRAPGDRPM